MATKASLSHIERTAEEPRDETLHRVTLSNISKVNDTIRLFRLTPLPSPKPITFKPGQWLDVHVPTILKPGGYTVTSSPSLLTSQSPYLELAIQKSPSNPPAAWLWQPEKDILGKQLGVRVGGSFVWPPRFMKVGEIQRVVFVAGGVGANPLVSMVSSLVEEKKVKGNLGFEVRFLYTTRHPGAGRSLEEVLFLERLREAFKFLGEDGELKLFLTRGEGVESEEIGVVKRRIDEKDLLEALGMADERGSTVCYICGVPGMTDEFVEKAKAAEGMVDGNVLCEKWW